LVSVLSFPENGGPLYVETQNHTDILDRIVKADHDSYCPDYTDDLEASGTLYIG
jgi:hypothetical protein